MSDVRIVLASESPRLAFIKKLMQRKRDAQLNSLFLCCIHITITRFSTHRITLEHT